MRKMENFIPASSEENLRPLEMPDCIYFDGAVQVRNSQCKRVFEKAVSLFSKRGETGRIPAALVLAPKRNGRRQANKNSGCLLWRKETLERLEQKGEMMRNEAVYGRRYGLIQRPWYL